MSTTNKTQVLIPEVLAAAIQGALAQKQAFVSDRMVATGALLINDTFGGDASMIGTEVVVPYFGTIGEMSDVTDGNDITPAAIQQTNETSTVVHGGIGFSLTRWAQSGVGDPYAEAARQAQEATQRYFARKAITAAVASGTLLSDQSSASLRYDHIVDARSLWGDEGDNVACMLAHSKGMASLRKLTDAVGRPLLVQPQDGSLPMLDGIPIIMSDAVTPYAASMGSVTSSGTSPPTVTLSGTASGNWSLVIEIQTGGTLGTATFRFSTDGGRNWSADIATGASVALTDTAVDSLVGNNGATGITAAFASGTYNADNYYTATTSLTLRTLLVKRNALAIWYNRAAMRLLEKEVPERDAREGYLHCYMVAHRYRRAPGGTKPGIVELRHAP
jgi:hypothetical protein